MVLLDLVNCPNSEIKIALWDWSGTIVDEEGHVSSDAVHWIHWFNEHNIPQCVISNEMNPAFLMSSVRKLELLEYFGSGEYVVCAGQNHVPKPATSMFFASLEKLGHSEIDPEQVVYIGDSQVDRAFAANCRCHFCPHTDLTQRVTPSQSH